MLIVLEGLDGAGKSTQVKQLKEKNILNIVSILMLILLILGVKTLMMSNLKAIKNNKLLKSCLFLQGEQH